MFHRMTGPLASALSALWPAEGMHYASVRALCSRAQSVSSTYILLHRAEAAVTWCVVTADRLRCGVPLLRLLVARQVRQGVHVHVQTVRSC
jgi:hypothetical protein